MHIGWKKAFKKLNNTQKIQAIHFNRNTLSF